MSTHPIPSPSGDTSDAIRWERLAEVQRLCRVYLREPSDVTDDGTTLSLVFTPNLTGPQTTTLNRLIAFSGLLRITPAEWQALEPAFAKVVTFRAPTRAQFLALTPAQQVVAFYDVQIAVLDVLKALLRS